MDYIVYLRNLENGREIQLHLPMEEEELKRVVEDLNPGGQHDLLIPDAWNEDGANYWKYYEYGNIFEINELLQAIEDSRIDTDLINAYVEAQEPFESVEDFEDPNWDDMYLYSGVHQMREVAESFIDAVYNLKDIPPIIANNIDYESIGDELDMEGCFFDTEEGILEIR